MKKKIYLVIDNHFDAMWRRCNDRPLRFNGESYVSYSDLQAYYIEDNLKLAQSYPDYKFQIETVHTAEMFLESHPDCREAFFQALQRGQLLVSGSGYLIIDSNMVRGESLVRNYLQGFLWMKENGHPLPRLAVRNDAFGNCAQLPQILLGCGFEWLKDTSYVRNSGKFWRGLDGSVIGTDWPDAVGGGGGWAKYAPCPACHGEKTIDGVPCKHCGGRGIDIQKAEKRRAPLTLPEKISEDFGIAAAGGEEFLPIAETVEIARRLQSRFDIRFAFEQEIADFIVRPFREEDCGPEKELNAACTGCYVTRIQIKQMIRELEHRMSSLETLDCLAFLSGNGSKNRGFRDVWKKMLFAMFHDAITGTHVDAAYAELMEVLFRAKQEMMELTGEILAILQAAEETSRVVFNTTGFTRDAVAEIPLPVGKRVKGLFTPSGQAFLLEEKLQGDVPCAKVLLSTMKPYEQRKIFIEYDVREPELKTEEEPGQPVLFSGTVLNDTQRDHTEALVNTNAVEVENDRLKITAGPNGIQKIQDKTTGRVLAAVNTLHPGELVLEHDEGSPWATLEDDRKQIPLSGWTKLEKVEKQELFQRLTYTVTLPFRAGGALDGLTVQSTITLYQGISQVFFETDADWHCFNERLRVAFPVCCTGRHLYETPYGILEREPYPPVYDWSGSNGDYPAIGWAGVQGANGWAVLFNKGTPSYRVDTQGDGSVIFLSLLRSPAIPTYLHEPESYCMTEWDGMRDEGAHHFSYALGFFQRETEPAAIVRAGLAYQTPVLFTEMTQELPQFPCLQQGNAVIGALKVAEKEEGIIVRVVSCSEAPQSVEMKLPVWVREVVQCDMLERPLKTLPLDGTMSLRPFEIATVLLRN